jgi:hypothetical protein
MRTTQSIVKQLDSLGVKNKFLIWPEIKQLPSILFEDEQIKHCIIGGHPSGFAIMLATDQRLILVDKVFFGLIVEEVPYGSIHGIRYSSNIGFGQVSVQLIDKVIVLKRVFGRSIHDFVRLVQTNAQLAQLMNRQSMSLDQNRLRGRQPELENALGPEVVQGPLGAGFESAHSAGQSAR